MRSAAAALPPAELMVIRALLANYPAAALNTVSSLAADAGVSAPTVLRLVERIGFSSFADLQSALRDELYQRTLTSGEPSPDHADEDPLRRSRRVFAQGIADTFASISHDGFARAVELICDPGNRVFATGGRFSSIVAKNLITTLEVLRPLVSYLSVEDRTSMLADFSSTDVVFVADLRRYQPNTIVFGEEAKSRGAKLIVFTDTGLSPLAKSADALLTCSVDAPHPLDSMVPAMAVTEALIAGIVDSLGTAPAERMRRYDAAWDSLGFSNQYWQRFELSEAALRNETS